MTDLTQLLQKTNVFAVVGASEDVEKYGYRVYKMLKDNGYRTYPVNPNRETVLGDKAYPSLDSVPEKIDVVSIITPPQVSLKVVEKAHQLGIVHIWLQPGAEDEAVIRYAEANGIELIHNQCILIEQGRKS